MIFICDKFARDVICESIKKVGKREIYFLFVRSDCWETVTFRSEDLRNFVYNTLCDKYFAANSQPEILDIRQIIKEYDDKKELDGTVYINE